MKNQINVSFIVLIIMSNYTWSMQDHDDKSKLWQMFQDEKLIKWYTNYNDIVLIPIDNLNILEEMAHEKEKVEKQQRQEKMTQKNENKNKNRMVKHQMKKARQYRK